MWTRSQFVATNDRVDRTCLLVFQCIVSSNRSLTVLTAGGTINNHHTSLWTGELMSAQLKVSLHHVATWSHSIIHHPPCCLYRETPCHTHKAYSKVAERNAHDLNVTRRRSRASIVTKVQTVLICWFNALRYNATCVNLVRACSLGVLFDLL